MGILDAAQPQTAPVQPPEQPMAAEPEQAAAQGPSNIHQRLILAAAKVLYTPKVTQAILEMIRKAPSPEVGLVQATVQLMVEMVKKSNDSIPPEVKTPISKKLMELIAELAEAAGLVDDVAAATRAASQLIAQHLQKLAQGQQQPAQQGGTQAPGAAQPPQQPPPMQQPQEEIPA